MEWARGKMAAFKVPRIVEFVDELPRTATGKILWRKLQEENSEMTRFAFVLSFFVSFPHLGRWR
jgi:fatty-acyl-CoA synthase